MKLLITAGGTKEPIDSVRFISNISTGQTGLFLTQAFLKAGHNVTLLIASGINIPSHLQGLVDLERFTTFTSLKQLLEKHLSHTFFDGAVHLAAVGDYYVAEAFAERTPLNMQKKITGFQKITLQLRMHPKLLPQLKTLSQNKDMIVVGFKLTDTTGNDVDQIQNMLSNKNIDVVVHNRLCEVKREQHIAQVYQKGHFLKKVMNKADLAKVLLGVLKNDFVS